MKTALVLFALVIACSALAQSPAAQPGTAPALPPPRSAKEATKQLPQRATQAIGETRETLGDIQQVLPQMQQQVDQIREDVGGVRGDVGAVREDVAKSRQEVAAAHAELDAFLRRITVPTLILLWSLAALVIVFLVRLVLPARRHTHA